MKVVFVHLGKAKARHLVLNIRRLLNTFPEIEIVTVLDRDSKKLSKKLDLPRSSTYEFDRDLAGSFFPEQEWDLKFRSGFWRFSFERFLALASWHRSHPDEALLHVESDVLLLPGFPFGAFKSLDKLTTGILSHDHDVAALLFSPRLEYTEWLASSSVQLLKLEPKLTDMTVLSRLRNADPQKFHSLPTWSNLWPLDEGSGFSRATNNILPCTLPEEMFGGVFDLAPIGVWLLGEDPRNHWGIKTRHGQMAGSYLNPADLTYRVDLQGNVTCTCNGVETKLFSLHVHSKEPKYFDSRWSLSLERDAHASVTNSLCHSFHFGAFFFVLRDRWKVLVTRNNFSKILALIVRKIKRK